MKISLPQLVNLLSMLVPGMAFAAALFRMWRVRVGGREVRDACPVYYKGKASGVAVWDRVLTPEERARIAALDILRIPDFPADLQAGLISYVPM